MTAASRRAEWGVSYADTGSVLLSDDRFPLQSRTAGKGLDWSSFCAERSCPHGEEAHSQEGHEEPTKGLEKSRYERVEDLPQP